MAQAAIKLNEVPVKIRRSRSFRNALINPEKFHTSQIKFYIILAPLVIFMGLPIVFIFFNAFKPLDELLLFPPRFTTQRPTFDNFILLFRIADRGSQPASIYLFNTIWVAISTILSTITISVCAGYVLSKREFRGRELLFKINQISMMFVPIAVVIPRYLVIANLGLLDTPLVHILPMLAMPVGLFLVKQFIDQIPDALVEAARIDGASDYYIVWKIITPLVKPALSTLFILSFQLVWTHTDTSAMFVEREALRTFAFFAGNLVERSLGSLAGMGIAAAAGLFMFIPNFIVFIILQSGVMNTMAHSGIK